VDDPRLPPPLDPVAYPAPSPAFTAQDLDAAGVDAVRISVFLYPLNAACAEFEINTPRRASMFLPQVAWESGHFRYLAEIWGPTPAQLRYPGGREWSGHGLIQVTGLENHEWMAGRFGIPMGQIAAWLQTPEGACRSAAAFWYHHGCNALADAGNFSAITKIINGGYTNLQERLAIYKSVAAEMGVA
jgi:putative chitinase